METLTRGERFVRTLTGEPVDHVPFGCGIGWHPWGETHARWLEETGRDDLDFAVELSYEDPSCSCPSLDYGVRPLFEKEVIEEGERTVVFRDERGIVMRHSKVGSTIPEIVESPVKDRYTWDKFKAERLQIDHERIQEKDWDAFRKKLADDGTVVQVGAFPFGVFGMPRDLMGVEEVLVAFYDDPEMMMDMMAHLTSLWIWIYEQVAAEVQIDHVHIWEDMSGRQGSLISPSMIEKFMMPCYDMVADFAHRHNVRVMSMDSDGDVSELVRIMTQHGVNMVFPFEVQAGSDILAYREQYPDLGIMGGLDKRVLGQTKKEVDGEIERCAKMLEHGRYVPGFDHLISPEATWENMRYAAEEIRKLCHGASNP